MTVQELPLQKACAAGTSDWLPVESEPGPGAGTVFSPGGPNVDNVSTESTMSAMKPPTTKLKLQPICLSFREGASRAHSSGPGRGGSIQTFGLFWALRGVELGLGLGFRIHVGCSVSEGLGLGRYYTSEGGAASNWCKH